MTKKQKQTLIRIAVSAVLFALLEVLLHLGLLERFGNAATAALFLVPYIAVGYDIFAKAAGNIRHGRVFDENFLMLAATVAAFCIREYPEAVAVMLLYQTGELFQSYAVGKSRRSIAAMMDIVPEYANVERDGALAKLDPDEVQIGETIVIKPGERIPLDGVVLEGESFVDTAALTGESTPRSARAGDEVVSGCVNGEGTLKVRVTKAFENSTVTRILELVENAASKKAKTENFITSFAKVYTPIVTLSAVLLAVLPPLIAGGGFGRWIERACSFLVISCPCALVISVPLGFFGGIGAASKKGVLVKGSNYLEALAKVKTVVFDKTGTLTKGEFTVTAVNPVGMEKEQLLELAALGEAYSNHPIAASVRTAAKGQLDLSRVKDYGEIAGRGVRAAVDGKELLLGSAALMRESGVKFEESAAAGTVVYAAFDGRFAGSIVISDTVKDEAKQAISAIKAAGVEKCVMLTGDRKEAAAEAARALCIDEYHAELLPADKVRITESIIVSQKGDGKTAFVGDGINDAPVLSRADVGIAMGSMGSDAAIEAADVVIMDDDTRKIAASIGIAKKTMRIVRTNIAFALAVKAAVLALSAFGLANMWMAVASDVGVCILAVLNSCRALSVK